MSGGGGAGRGPTVTGRLLRGYGPLVAFVALILLISLLVPSKVPEDTAVNATGVNATGPGAPPAGAAGSSRAPTSSAAASSAPDAGSSPSGGPGGSATPGGPDRPGDSAGPGTPAGPGGSAGPGTPAGSRARAGPGSTPSAPAAARANKGPRGEAAADPTAGQPRRDTGAAGARAARPPSPSGGVGTCDRKSQVPGDPYSPPCRTFSGDNGGATSRGVTGKEIHLSVRMGDGNFQQTLAEVAGAEIIDSPESILRTLRGLVDYFNRTYQFYGRKIVLDVYRGQGKLTEEVLGQGQAAAEADATRVAQEIRAFGDLTGYSEPYADALTRRKVMAFNTLYLSREFHADRAPYAWSAFVDGSRVASLAGEYLAKKLCPQGTPATRAGGSVKDKPRKFAILAPDSAFFQESVQRARDVISDAGCDPGLNLKYRLDLGTLSNQMSGIVAKLRSEGVTTLLCGCDPISPVFLSSTAARQNYFPEFVIPGTALIDTDLVAQLWNQEFAAHTFGVSPNGPPVPPTQTLGYAAYKTVRDDEPAQTVPLLYYGLAHVAIGIQMAGPNLTPQTYQQGMFAYKPRSGRAGLWSFGPGDWTTTDDVREIYWDPEAISAINNKKGAYRGTGKARWKPGEIPDTALTVPVPG